MSESDSLLIHRAQAQELMRRARAAAPAECCGLLIGSAGAVREILPLTNAAARPAVAYLAEPGELLRALMEIEASGDELLAIYHSHPQGDATPSETDIREAAYPQALQVIIGLAGGSEQLAAWRLESGTVRRAEIIVDEDGAPAGELADNLGESARARPWLLAAGALITLALFFALALAAYGTG